MNSRAKGARGERELAEYLREHGHTARRGQQFSGGADSPDVVCPTLPGYHIECKRVERVQLHEWLAQAKRDAGVKVPVVMHKKNRGGWIAILPLEDFLALTNKDLSGTPGTNGDMESSQPPETTSRAE